MSSSTSRCDSEVPAVTGWRVPSTANWSSKYCSSCASKVRVAPSLPSGMGWASSTTSAVTTFVIEAIGSGVVLPALPSTPS
jgi:hypothetical protein